MTRSAYGEPAVRYNDVIVTAFDRFALDITKVANVKYNRITKVELSDSNTSTYSILKSIITKVRISWFEGGTQTIFFGLNHKGEIDWVVPFGFKSFFITFPDCKAASIQEAVETCLKAIETASFKEEEFPPYQQRQYGFGI